MSNWRGRRVTEPQPIVRGLLSEHAYGNGLSELESAWNAVGKVKSTLRRAEHRLADAEKPTAAAYAAESLLKDTDSQHRVAVDRVPSYRLDEPTDRLRTGAILDNHGRTQYLKSQTTRKVSRLEDKYTDGIEVAQPRQRSPLREPNHEYVHKNIDHTDRYSTRNAAYNTDPYSSASRGNTHLSTRADTFNTYGNSTATSAAKDSSRFNLTDSRAIRETEINFLNDDGLSNLLRRYKRSEYEHQSHPARLTHVGVTVPHVGLTTGDYLGSGAASSEGAEVHHPLLGLSRMTRSEEGLAASSGDSATSVNNTFTKSSSSRARKLRKYLKNLDQDSDGLAKLKEKIRQQRSSMPSRELTEPAAAAVQHVSHKDTDAIIPRTYMEYENEQQVPKVRKIAAGPPAPSYKGFAEVETRFRSPGGQIVKLSEWKKSHRLQKERKLISKKEQQKGDAVVGVQPEVAVDKTDKHPPKAARVTASVKKPSKHNKQGRSDIITPSSWRAGQKVILQELGHAKLPKTSHSPPTRDQEHKENRDSDSDNDIEENKKDVPKQENNADHMRMDEEPKALSEEAKAILNDLQSDHSDHEEEAGDEETKKKITTKRKRQKFTEEEKQEKIAKVKHYDSDEVRRYIARQKALKKKKVPTATLR